ncbi:PREDICTED: glycerophosphodiester phosphodiesterase domain-containing protein 3-like isoform X1 [Poecilia mexicana]|uniref:GP-PDE domain-containing protein n=1 Tax=Poecilia mexicana TaxID=48701 RepID=A0A3B3Z5X6_9TELE|nr:PREDICTED: glycerophosphodiester phosphodiesterase domain-containing protein 3-like isoform X1 [Poecilia mexicana]
MSVFLSSVLPPLGLYTLISRYLLKNPHHLHRKKKTAFYCTQISHRGGSGEKIENTMEAFTNAIENGSQMLEMDCHLTKDGHVVVSHDENLKRQTGVDKDISSLNLEDLPPYKERLEVTFNAGHENKSGTDRKIALLEDVFRKFPKIPVSIEIKEDNPQLMREVSTLARRYDREGITLWASEDAEILNKCRSINGAMPYSFSKKRGILLLLLYYTGLLPFVPVGESVLQFYLPRIINRTYKPENTEILKKSWVISLIDKTTMRKNLFKHLADRGIQVHLFVCNKNEDIKAAFDLGATGVMTDYPTLLSTYVRTHMRVDDPNSSSTQEQVLLGLEQTLQDQGANPRVQTEQD